MAAGEFMRDVGLDLIAPVSRVAGIARARSFTPEPADVEAGGAGQGTAVIEIEPMLAIVEPRRGHDNAALLAPVLRQEVDDAARRIGSKRGCRTPADRLDRGKRGIGPQKDIGIAESNVPELHDRHAVFLQLHELGPARNQRKAAYRYVRVPFAAGGFHMKSG